MLRAAKPTTSVVAIRLIYLARMSPSLLVSDHWKHSGLSWVQPDPHARTRQDRCSEGPRRARRSTAGSRYGTQTAPGFSASHSSEIAIASLSRRPKHNDHVVAGPAPKALGHFTHPLGPILSPPIPSSRYTEAIGCRNRRQRQSTPSGQ